MTIFSFGLSSFATAENKTVSGSYKHSAHYGAELLG
jgi:hypothetical protein